MAKEPDMAKGIKPSAYQAGCVFAFSDFQLTALTALTKLTLLTSA